MKERYEKEKRRKDSIIICGIPASDAVNKFYDIIRFLLCPGTNSITLSDAVPLKSYLVCCKIANQQHRSELLPQCKKLAGSQFSYIYINRNLTFTQRSDLKKKRAVRAGLGSGGGAMPKVTNSVVVGVNHGPPVFSSISVRSTADSAFAMHNFPLLPSNLTLSGSVRDWVTSLQAGL